MRLVGDLRCAIHRVGDMKGCLKSTLAPVRKISLDTCFWYSGFIGVIAESKNKRAARRVGLTRNGLSGGRSEMWWWSMKETSHSKIAGDQKKLWPVLAHGENFFRTRGWITPVSKNDILPFVSALRLILRNYHILWRQTDLDVPCLSPSLQQPDSISVVRFHDLIILTWVSLFSFASVAMTRVVAPVMAIGSPTMAPAMVPMRPWWRWWLRVHDGSGMRRGWTWRPAGDQTRG